MSAAVSGVFDRQTAKYDPANTEVRYETRLRAMIDAKIKGEGFDRNDVEPAPQTNVIDLMAALKKSRVEAKPAEPAPVVAKATTAAKKAHDQATARRRTALKLPVEGGKDNKAAAIITRIDEPERVSRPRRKAS